MTRRTIVLAPAAEDDIQKAFLWYAERNRLAAEAFRADVFKAVEHIANSCLHLAGDETGMHKRVMKRFPFSLFYELGSDTVTVLAVAHHRRRPGYWKSHS